MMRMKVGVSRKEATGRDGSVGATCEIEIEIPGGTPDQEMLRIRDHWLEFCETAVDDEIDRLRDGSPDAGREPAARPRVAPPPAERREHRSQGPPRARRDADDDRSGPDESRPAPSDGRQLLGWAAKQDPDAKGLVIEFGKRKGYPPKIVDWDDEQVRIAYRYAKDRLRR